MYYRKAYGLPERYFLSLGRMVEKKNLSTLVEAYARFARASGERSRAETGNLNRSEAEIAHRQTSDESGRRKPVAGEKLKVKSNDGEKHGDGSREHGVRSASAQNDYGVTREETADGVDAAATKAEPRLCETGLSQNCELKTEHCPPGLVFVGSGELEGALREQARGLGLRVIDRTDWRAGESSHGLTRIDADRSERLAADRTGGNASCRVTPAVGEGPQKITDDCKLAAESSRQASQRPTDTGDSVENDRGSVYFYGFRQIEENPVFYALAEAFVLPSLKEEWGLVVNEAMAAGLPVIVSRTAGCAEDLVPKAPASGSMEHGARSMESGEEKKTDGCKLSTDDALEERSNGFVFDPESSDALSEALKRVAEGITTDGEDAAATLNAEMGRRSREIVAKFSCENFARQALRAAEAGA